jgi:hypothetical protein
VQGIKRAHWYETMNILVICNQWYGGASNNGCQSNFVHNKLEMKKTRPCKIIRKFSNNEHEWKLWAQFDVLLSFYVYELYEYTKVNSVVDEVEDAKKKKMYWEIML